MQENLGIENAAFVEELYEDWKKTGASVSDHWNEYFKSLDEQKEEHKPASYKSTQVYKQGRVDSLIWGYRDVGYLSADLNPLHGYITQDLKYLYKTIEGSYKTLEPADFGLESKDLQTVFRAGRGLSPEKGTLQEILNALRQTYCSYMGVEILHIQNRTMRGWLMEKIEQNNNTPFYKQEQKQEILFDLIKSEEFERFIHSNYIGQKRFSLEGAESLIPALHHLIDSSARGLGIQEIVLGMAHRGRLNVLTNLMQKPDEEIFSTFEDKELPHEVGGSGDVKYHLGFSTDHKNTDGSSVHLSLLPNPSHLESVDPVVEGKARGAQRKRNDTHRKKVVPVLIHGDAAFSGQGVVTETLNLSQLRGYKTGGTIHIIVNNQIGFTTASRDARSTFFCTDVAKSMPVPIFHVNGDHPEYVVRAIDLAIQFRQKFGYDAVVDIFCYRRYGHNEADDPSFTHPKMYNLIKKAGSVAKLYGQALDKERVISLAEQEKFRKTYRASLKKALISARTKPVSYITDGFQFGEWRNYKKEYSDDPIQTGVSEDILRSIGKTITTAPDGFQVHPKLARILGEKSKMFLEGRGFDWATAEALSFGSLALEGVPIRLSGEDSGRGTFSQRHAVWWNTVAEDPEPYTPLSNLSPNQGRFRVYDSPLSEFSVLGFEYGNALVQPEMLCLWEAQFGDFCNGAQVIIDQFIAAGESKWDRGNGLVLLLPHGYEGQGPEHSSAHLARFLQLCAEENIQVCNPTTPDQYFHLLRRQMKRSFRKPLVIMTPKSLLRSKEATSDLSTMTTGTFVEVQDDPKAEKDASTVVFCSGKVFYNLRRERAEKKKKGYAIIRLEQLYPFPEKQIAAVISRYDKADRFVWVQEESKNRGAWNFICGRSSIMTGGKDLQYIGREASASPATGSYKKHLFELDTILESLFD